ncbi:GNAT family N-acetyltransferase [Deinococcus pimensis]|uniref:GNAT family N-acetyltransferase n=1 Tax=Deinococcus pimensis TaxID=309888 RepID=UPI0004819EEF|nr:GNAT family N-acetyltransferase [Deinococcus pimensis]
MTTARTQLDTAAALLDVHAAAERRDAFNEDMLDRYRMLPEDLRERAGIERVPFSGGVLHLMRAMPVPTFNPVRGLGLDRPATDADVEALLEVVEASRAQGWGLVVDPRTRPVDLPDLLATYGLGEAFRLLVLYASASTARAALKAYGEDGPTTADLTREHRSGAVAVLAEAFGMPDHAAELFPQFMTALDWKGYVVEEEDGLGSAGLLTVLGDMALLHTTATRPRSRGRGGQTALIARRFREGLRVGCEHFFVDVAAGEGNASRRNLERMGFRAAFEVTYYTRPNET